MSSGMPPSIWLLGGGLFDPCPSVPFSVPVIMS
jgi:hypothetical protein